MSSWKYWKAFGTQWKTPEGVPGLRVTYVALKALCDRVVFLSALDRCVVDSTSDSSGELTKCQGSTPRLVEPSVTSGPCINSYESLGPSFPFRLSFKLNKVTDHHKGNIHNIVWRKKRCKMKLFTLLCLDYKQIFTPVLGLQLMKNREHRNPRLAVHWGSVVMLQNDWMEPTPAASWLGFQSFQNLCMQSLSFDIRISFSGFKWCCNQI